MSIPLKSVIKPKIQQTYFAITMPLPARPENKKPALSTV